MADTPTTERAVIELRRILAAVDQDEWLRHSTTGERVKRICLTGEAIDRMREAVAGGTEVSAA